MLAFAFALCLAFVGGAKADTLRADHIGPAFGSVDINYSIPSKSGTARAGAFNMQRLPDLATDTGFPFDPLPFPGAEFYAFCIELRQTIQDNVLYDVVELKDGRDTGTPSPIGVQRADLVRAVLGAANFVNFQNPLPAYAGFTQAVTSAAIQVAIWEVVYETLDPVNYLNTAFNVTTGIATFGTGQTSAAVVSTRNLANILLSNISATSPRANNIFALNSLKTGGSQDLIIQVNVPTVEEPIPEPATMALMGVGLLALGFFRKRVAA